MLVNGEEGEALASCSLSSFSFPSLLPLSLHFTFSFFFFSYIYILKQERLHTHASRTERSADVMYACALIEKMTSSSDIHLHN